MLRRKFKAGYLKREALNQCRAYEKLVDTYEGETQIWRNIEKMVDICPVSSPECFKGIVPERYEKYADYALRQKLLNERLGPDIAPALMLAQADVNFPKIVRLPASWRASLKDNGATLHPLCFLFWCQLLLLSARQGMAAYRRTQKAVSC